MKRLIAILLILALCIAFAGCGGKKATADTNSSSKPSSDTDSATSEPTGSEPEKEEEYKVDFGSIEMKLPNIQNPIKDEDIGEMATVNSKYAGYANARFDAGSIGNLHDMCAAAEGDGIKLTVTSAFRSENDQLSIFNAKVNEVMDSDITLTLNAAEDIAKTQVAFPRTSEHELGLAVDFSTDAAAFKETAAYDWLIENCYDYGFIPRFENHPSHFRYVGVKNAPLIKESGLSLEEYIEKYGPKN